MSLGDNRKNNVSKLLEVLKATDTSTKFKFRSDLIDIRCSDDGLNVGFYAKEDITKGTLLANIQNLKFPTEELISFYSNVRCKDVELLADEIAKDVHYSQLNRSCALLDDDIVSLKQSFQQYLLLTTYLLLRNSTKEKMGKNDILGAYFDSLPLNDIEFHETMPLLWNNRQKIASLDGTAVGTKLNLLIFAVDKIAENIVRPRVQEFFKKLNIQIKDEDTIQDPLREKQIINCNNITNTFKYVFCNVESRCFDGLGDTSALVPIIELVNGVPSYTKAVNVYYHYVPESQINQLVSVKDISKGDELYINYGDVSSSGLFLKYGYVYDLDNLNKSYCLDSVQDCQINIRHLFESSIATPLELKAIEATTGLRAELVNRPDFYAGQVPLDRNFSQENPSYRKLKQICMMVSFDNSDELMNDVLSKQQMPRGDYNNFKLLSALLTIIGGHIRSFSHDFSTDQNLVKSNSSSAPLLSSISSPASFYSDRCMAKLRLLERDMLCQWGWFITTLFPMISERERLGLWRKHIFFLPEDMRKKGEVLDGRYCTVCGFTLKVNLCSACKSTAYCSKDHQKKDWKTHKVMCKN